MAEARITEDEFLCPVCLDLLKDPVTISCGHSFCWSCIRQCWDLEEERGSYRCPQCRETFYIRPALAKNIILAEMLEKLKNKPSADHHAGDGDVPCDACKKRKYKAVKSCVKCQESYCLSHLERHEEFHSRKRHRMIEATDELPLEDQQLMIHDSVSAQRTETQAQHVFSPVIQGSARMITPSAHAQPGLVSSSTTQYGEQAHTMYVSPTPIPQQFAHPNSTLHPHAQHPQPSATPTGQPQQGSQHGGNHPAPSPVQHPQHQAAAAAAQAIHLGNPQQQPMYSALAPTPPSMNPGPNPQSPQASFPSAQQAVYIHTQQMQHGYNPNHMAHVQQAHMQSGMVPPHHGTPAHPPTVMLMTTPAPAGPQPALAQGTLNPIPVSSATHYSYTLTPVQTHHQQQM